MSLLTDSLVLEKIQVAISEQISENVAYVMNNAEWQSHLEATTQRMVLRLKSHVLAHSRGTIERTEELAVEIYASPWQAVKAWWAQGDPVGRWWCRRWPVRMETVRKTARLVVSENDTFPDAGIAYPKELGRVVIQRLDATPYGGPDA